MRMYSTVVLPENRDFETEVKEKKNRFLFPFDDSNRFESLVSVYLSDKNVRGIESDYTLIHDSEGRAYQLAVNALYKEYGETDWMDAVSVSARMEATRRLALKLLAHSESNG